MIKEAINELVLSKAIDKVNKYKSKKEWNDLFINTGEFLLKEVDGGEFLIDDISNLLSGDNMKELAEKADKESKYLLRDVLDRELKRLMLQYEIPACEAEFYISGFMMIIMHELEGVALLHLPALIWENGDKRKKKTWLRSGRN